MLSMQSMLLELHIFGNQDEALTCVIHICTAKRDAAPMVYLRWRIEDNRSKKIRIHLKLIFLISSTTSHPYTTTTTQPQRKERSKEKKHMYVCIYVYVPFFPRKKERYVHIRIKYSLSSREYFILMYYLLSRRERVDNTSTIIYLSFFLGKKDK